MVTGGINYDALDSTEVLVEGAAQWLFSAPLPSPRTELQGATLGNKIIVTGGQTTETPNHLQSTNCNYR